MTPDARKVLFSFDPKAYERLKTVQKECGYAFPNDVVRDALSVYFALRDNAKEGFHKITVTNPRTGKERIFADPGLELLLTCYFPQDKQKPR